MPICQPCLDAGSGADYGPIPVCSVCGNGPVNVYGITKPIEEQSVVVHKRTLYREGGEFRRFRCPGSGEPPRWQTGHDYCDGCPCQHRPRGSWKGKRDE